MMCVCVCVCECMGLLQLCEKWKRKSHVRMVEGVVRVCVCACVCNVRYK